MFTYGAGCFPKSCVPKALSAIGHLWDLQPCPHPARSTTTRPLPSPILRLIGRGCALGGIRVVANTRVRICAQAFAATCFKAGIDCHLLLSASETQVPHTGRLSMAGGVCICLQVFCCC